MADHKMVQQMFRQAERAKEKPDQLREIVEAACAALTLHAEIEEQHFYPAMRETGKDTDMIAEAYVEHASAKQLIAELEGGDPEDEEYAAKFKVLGEYVKHHIKEEENEIFPKARRARADFGPLLEALVARDEAVMAEGGEEGETAGLNGSGRASRSAGASGSRSGRGGSQSGRSGSQGASQSGRSGSSTSGGRGSRSSGGSEESDSASGEARGATRGRQARSGRGSSESAGGIGGMSDEAETTASEQSSGSESSRRSRRGGQDETTDVETGARGRDSESEEQEGGSSREGR
jgi:hemerythrin superfamily protein